MLFIYWNNKNGWHSEKLAEITADNIIIADEKFEKITGFNVVKCTWIGCSIEWR